MTQLDESPVAMNRPDEHPRTAGPGRPGEGGPPRVAVESDQDWDGRAWTGREADRPAAITDADRTQVVPDHITAPAPPAPPAPAAPGSPGAGPLPVGADPERTQVVPDPERTQVVPDPERTQAVLDAAHSRAAEAAADAAGPDGDPGTVPVADPGVESGDVAGDDAAADTQWVPRESIPTDRPPHTPSRPVAKPRPVVDGRAAARQSRPEAGPGARAPGPPPPAPPARPWGPAAPGSGPAPPVGPHGGSPAGGPGQPPGGARPAAGGGLRDSPGSWPTMPPPPPGGVASWPGTDRAGSPGWPAPAGLETAAAGGAAELAPVEAFADTAADVLAEDVAVRGLAREGLTRSLVAAARQAWPPIDAELLDEVAAAGETAHVRALADPRAPVADGAAATAVERTTEATEAAVAVSRLADRHEPGDADWTLGGLVIPVIGATARVGASVAAAALYDALDACGVSALLVDAADPARSGLAAAVGEQGKVEWTLHPKVGVGYAQRGAGFVAQLATPPSEVFSARMVPSPSWWLPDHPPDHTGLAATVVDLGWDPWQATAAPLRGPGAWLEAGDPPPRPVLVVEATRPSLAQANTLLARLRPWIRAGQLTAPAALIVIGASRWPRAVTGVAARVLGELMGEAVFLPHDRDIAVGGIGPGPVPDRLRAAAAAIPARWGLIPDTRAPTATRPLTRLLRKGHH